MSKTQKFNLKNIINSGWIKKITSKLGNNSRQELEEYEYYTDIKGILTEHPENIEQSIFQGQTQYLIYSSRNQISEGGDLLGTFYTITPEKIGRSGYFYRSNLSNAFARRVYKEVAEHYNTRFQPKAER